MEKTFLSLHPAQQDVYTDQLVNAASPHYNIGGYITLKGSLNKEKFKETVRSIPQVFDAFKMRFIITENGEPQYFQAQDYEYMELPERDFSGHTDPAGEAMIWMQQQFNSPFNLQEADFLFENCLIKIAADEHWYFGRFHHLLTDGFGFIVFVQYIAQKYTSLLQDDGLQFLYPSYMDEAATAAKYFTSPDYEADAAYWKTKISDKPVKMLAAKYPPLNANGKSSSTYIIDINPARKKLLDDLQINTRAGLQHLTIAALLIYFGKISTQEEFVFGVPLHKRSSKKLKEIVGMFSGVLPYKGIYQKDIIVADLIKDITHSQRMDYRHQQYQIGDLSRDLKMISTDGYLQEITINYEPLNFELNFGELLDTTIVRLASDHERNPLQICWREYGNDQPLRLHINYGNEFFSEAEIELFINRLLFIIEQFPANLDNEIGNIKIVPAEEMAMLENFYETPANVYPQKNLVTLFKEQVATTPHNIAMIFEEQELTYFQLDERSNQLAFHLQSMGVTTEMLVPLFIERSAEMMVAILGILKAGGAYVPIDPEYPAERIAFILEDTSCKFCVSSMAQKSKLAAFGWLEIILMDDEHAQLDVQQNANPLLDINPDQLAYVIYTSGSTGKPKGVMIEHRTVVNLIDAQTDYFKIKNDDRILQFSNYCFDASVEQIFLAWLNGATLVLFKEGLQLKIDLFENFLVEKEITHLHATPSFLENLAGIEHTYLRRVIAGGDLCKRSLADYWKNKVSFYNEYGPTETTVTSIEFKAGANESGQTNSLPIGKPLKNIQVYIVDKNNAICPIGVTGELCIGGDCLARGYLNRPELTAEKFVKNYFDSNSTKLMYRTGDSGYWLPDGNIVYLGRMDEQVKIRGYRIELGEIENVLQSSVNIKQAAVLARNDKNGNKRLVGYVVPAGAFSATETQAWLKNKLPEYMIPALWVELEMLPMTLNGKVDKKSLPDPEAGEWRGSKFVAPANEMETQLTALWTDVLKVENIGVQDNFFELGGHSLNAIQLTTRLHKSLQLKTDIATIFANPTIEQLAKALASQEKSQFVQIRRLPQQTYYPLSHAQERFWILSHFKDGSEAYNVANAFTIEGNLKMPAFKKAFDAVIERHEILRTVFVEVDGKAQQQILSVNEAGFVIEEIDATKNSDKETFIKNWLKEDATRAFDLSKGPLFRATIFREEAEKFTLVFNIHHIISDGWSKGIFIKEFLHFYKVFSTGVESNLTPLPIQYKDYAAWHSEAFALQGQYWQQLYKDNIPVLNFPTDFERPKVLTFFGAMLSKALPEALTISLRKMAAEHNMSLNNLFFSLYGLIVARYSNQHEVVIGSLSSGRSHIDLENLVGVFINFLPVKISLNRQQKLTKYLSTSNEAMSLAFNNQDYPFDLMVAECIKQRDVARNPFFDTMLNFHLENAMQGDANFGGNQINETGIEIKPQQSLQDELFQSVLDFKLDIEPSANTFELYLSYNSKLFKEETMGRFLDEFVELLQMVVDDADKNLEEYGEWDQTETIAVASPVTEQATLLPLAICASFVMEPLQEYIEYWSNEVELNIDISFAPYNQVFQQLLHPQSLLNTNTGINVLFIRLDDWLRDQQTSTASAQIELLDQNYHQLTNAIEQLNKQNFVPYLVGIVPLLNLSTYSNEVVVHINHLNGQLQQLIKKQPTFHLLDLDTIARLYEVEERYDAKSDELGHMPFTQEYYAAIGTYLARKVNAFKGPNYKVIALDCDNTLWKGICGELGPKDVSINENFARLQDFFITKYHEGFLLVLCSKNNEADVWEVFNQHPGMKLKREHIAAHRINWEPKSDNILSIAQELNLGINSFIFLDDSEFEVEQMTARAPEVLAISLPGEEEDYESFLSHIWAFDFFRVTEEDAKRNDMYKVEKQRREEEVKYESVEEFLQSLNIQVNIHPLNELNMERAVQLTLRTNQFNLNGIRKTAEEIARGLQQKNAINWIIEVQDRFGDYGIVGVVLAKKNHVALEVETFLLSCRVLGRNVEDHIVTELEKYCENNGLNKITALFQATQKNKPFQEFLKRTGWIADNKTNAYERFLNEVELKNEQLFFIDPA